MRATLGWEDRGASLPWLQGRVLSLGQPHHSQQSGEWKMETISFAGSKLDCSPSLCSQLFCCQKSECHTVLSQQESHGSSPVLGSHFGQECPSPLPDGKTQNPDNPALPEEHHLNPEPVSHISNKEDSLPCLPLRSNWYLFLRWKKSSFKSHLFCAGHYSNHSTKKMSLIFTKS